MSTRSKFHGELYLLGFIEKFGKGIIIPYLNMPKTHPCRLPEALYLQSPHPPGERDREAKQKRSGKLMGDPEHDRGS